MQRSPNTGSLAALRGKLESGFHRELSGKLLPNYLWREDGITEAILGVIRANLLTYFYTASNSGVELRVDPRKLTGSAEYDHGDICLLVDIRRDGRVAQGVAYLEAKKGDLKSGKYAAFRPDQLERIQKKTPGSVMLLYRPVSRPWEYEAAPELAESIPNSAVVVSPGSAMLDYRFGDYVPRLPLSIQICHRYLQGFDLLHGDAAIAEALEGNSSMYYVVIEDDDGIPLRQEHRRHSLRLQLPEHLRDIQDVMEMRRQLETQHRLDLERDGQERNQHIGDGFSRGL